MNKAELIAGIAEDTGVTRADVLKVTDKVAQKDYTQEATFEVKPAAK